MRDSLKYLTNRSKKSFKNLTPQCTITNDIILVRDSMGRSLIHRL